MMMLWRRKKGEAYSQPLPSFFTRALTYVNGKLIRLAASLQQRTSQLSSRGLKLLVGLFCLASLSASTYVVINSFGAKEVSFRVAPIQAMPLARRPLRQSIISEKEFRQLHRLRLSLDSLAKTSSGKAVYDSLLKEHPNLLDTLKLLENIYLEQLKK